MSQLESTPSALEACADQSLRAIVAMDARDAHDAGMQLERLSTHLSRCSRPPVELVVLNAPAHDSFEELLDYLRHAQPLWSTFLEAHPTVGSSHGKLNAHGTAPLGHHTHGVVHRLHGLDGPRLAEVVEIYTPTRLALVGDNLIGDRGALAKPSPSPQPASSLPPPMASDGLSDELEAVTAVADLLYARPCDWSPASCSVLPLWDEVWSSQQLDGAREAYVACTSEPSAAAAAPGSPAAAAGVPDCGREGGGEDAEDEACRQVASRLRARFEECAAWREGAESRRAAALAAARTARLLAPTSVTGPAIASFGLTPADLDGGDATLRARLKERWRELALRAHPDVTGGSGERFQQLRQHYKTLMRAVRA